MQGDCWIRYSRYEGKYKKNKNKMARIGQYDHLPTSSATSIKSQMALNSSEDSNEDGDFYCSNFNASYEISMPTKKVERDLVLIFLFLKKSVIAPVC